MQVTSRHWKPSLAAAVLTVGAVGAFAPGAWGIDPVVEPVPSADLGLVLDGVPFDGNACRIWTPFCMAGLEPTEAEFAEAIEMGRAVLDALPREPREPNPALGTIPFDIEFAAVNPPLGAAAALDAVEAYLESRFAETRLTQSLLVDVTFADLGTMIGGVSSPLFAELTYDYVRGQLAARQDQDDFIADWLPAGTTYPVRFDGSSASVTDVGTIFMTCANIQAALNAACAAGGGSIVVNTNPVVAWDYDPTDGVAASTYCFRSVMVHETLHTLGFISTVGAVAVPSMFDFFRFQRSANNPGTFPAFRSTARVFDANDPDDDHQFDTVLREYRLSDGTPHGAGHFRQEASPIGIMDPVLDPAETFHPDFVRASDLDVMDAMGFDHFDLGSPMSGNVNGAVAGRTVLEVNAKKGWVEAPASSPISVRFNAAPAGGDGRYVLWVWRGFQFGPGYPIVGFPYSLCCTLMPSPLAFSSPLPIRALRAPNVPPAHWETLIQLPSPAAVPFTRTKPNGLPAPTTLTLQGLVWDSGSASPTGISVTNAVILRIL